MSVAAIRGSSASHYIGTGYNGSDFSQNPYTVTIDGQVGPRTLQAINQHPDPRQLFQQLWQERKAYFERLAQKPTQRKFLAGWLNRLDGIRYDRLITASKKTITW